MAPLKNANPPDRLGALLNSFSGMKKWPKKAKANAGRIVDGILTNPWLPLVAVLFAMAFSVNDTIAGVKTTLPKEMQHSAWLIVLSLEGAVLLALAIRIYHPTVKIEEEDAAGKKKSKPGYGAVELKSSRIIKLAYCFIIVAAMKYYLLGDNGNYKGAFDGVVVADAWGFLAAIPKILGVLLGALLHASPSIIGFCMEDLLMSIPAVKAIMDTRRAAGLQAATVAETGLSLAVMLTKEIRVQLKAKETEIAQDDLLKTRIGMALQKGIRAVTSGDAIQKLLGSGK